MIDLDAYEKTTGEGRNVLEARIRDLCAEVKQLRAWLRVVHENLGATQQRCNELLNQSRALRNGTYHSCNEYPRT